MNKTFTKAGNLGFPEEEVLHDGLFVKKIARSTLLDHATKGRRVESLKIEEFRRTKKADEWPEQLAALAR